MKIKTAFFCNNSTPSGGQDMLDYVYAQGRRQRVIETSDCYPTVITKTNFAEHVDRLQDLAAIFSTWGMPALTSGQIQQLPALKAVFYAAGSPKGFARPFLEQGITVCSAWAANAVPVAEFTLAQILLSCKGYFRNSQACRKGRQSEAHRGAGTYGETIALIGAGQIGRKVIELLKPFHLRVLVVDPYLSADAAAELGAEQATLAEAFSQAYVISNHLPNLEQLRGILNEELFASMRRDATFINTGRGAQVDEAGLVAVLAKRPDLTALLDVTYPEPPVQGSPFYTLPNVHLSSHIAGSLNDETVRMADYMLEEFAAWQAGTPLRYSIDLKMLDTMA
jgi:phosphoglycerate dehydrogenase-like enzyme